MGVPVPVTISSRRVRARRNLHTEGAEARVPRSADMILRARTGCTMEQMAAIRPHGSGGYVDLHYCDGAMKLLARRGGRRRRRRIGSILESAVAAKITGSPADLGFNLRSNSNAPRANSLPVVTATLFRPNSEFISCKQEIKSGRTGTFLVVSRIRPPAAGRGAWLSARACPLNLRLLSVLAMRLMKRWAIY